MNYSAYSTYSCIRYYEFFKLAKLLGGGGGKTICLPPIFSLGGGGGGDCPPVPPGSTPLPLCISAIPVTVVQPGFVNGGPKRGSEATERGEGVVSPSHGREIFQKFVSETFIRGSLWSGIDQFPTLVLFLMNFFQGKFFLFPFFLLLFYSPINGGGGVMAPLCILAIPVTVVQPRFVNGGKARVWEGGTPYLPR